MRKCMVFIALCLSVVLLVSCAFSESAGGDAGNATVVDGIDMDIVAGVDGTEDAPPETLAGMQDDVPDDAQEEGGEPAVPTPSPEPTRAPVVNHDFTIDTMLGYEGLVMLARWTPFYVTVTNNGTDFDGLLGVNVFLSQTQYDRYEIPLTLASGATKRVLLPVKPQARQDMYAIELTDKGQIIAEQRVVPSRLVAPEAVTVGVLSEDAAALSYMNQRANGLDTLRGETWLTVPLTAELFPESADLMGAYNMLVVDGVDVRTLSDEQQAALTAWLNKGGVVFVSGGAKAATGYPFFSQWTDLTAGTLAEAEDITPALIAYMTLPAKPVEEGIWLSGIPAQGALVSTDTQGLVRMDRVGDGLVYTAAFDMGGQPLSTWSTMSSFWPRLLRQSASAEYISLLNRAEENRYSNEGYRAQELIRTLRIENDESGVPILLLLVAYLFIVGFGGYIVLKKFDKREWLWAAVPLSAAAFALILMLMSGNSRMNEPVALTASRIYITGDDAQVATYIGVATANQGELEIETDQPQLPSVLYGDYYYSDYYDNTKDRLYRPVDLRQRMQLGARPKVGFASANAWEAKMLMLDNVAVEMGTLDARLWMEDDGVHGEVANNTDVLLKNCFVVTTFGFANLGDLMPGQTAELAMLLPTKPIDFSDPKFTYKPNIMYTSLDIDQSNMNYVSNDMYQYLQEAVYGQFEDRYADPEAQKLNALVQLFESKFYYYNSSAAYYFFGFNDSLGQISVQLNGKPVSRTAHTAIVGTDMEFEPIGPTGKVLFHQGLIPAEIMVDLGEDQKPRVPTDEDGDSDAAGNVYQTKDTYLNIGAAVALRFVLPDADTYNIEKMTLAGYSYETVPTLHLYNNETKAWDAQALLSVSMSGEDWAPYIDDEGAVYIRYTPSDTGNRYVGMSMPTIALKGEVK